MCRPPVSDDKTPSTLARFTTASILVAILSLWGYYAYPPRDATPGLTTEMHSYQVPLALTAFYLISLPSLKWFTENYLAPKYDMKLLLTESMIIYNVAQVFLNGWMVYAIIDALVYRGHPFIGSRSLTGVAISSGSSYAVWVHYCDKYLEFFDTYFMILRGNMKQVSFCLGSSKEVCFTCYRTARTVDELINRHHRLYKRESRFNLCVVKSCQGTICDT
jgi:elongation of very long chain fatty acids protein 4